MRTTDSGIRMTTRPVPARFLRVVAACLSALALFAIVDRGTVLSQELPAGRDSCVITRTETFEGAGLAGHINGGAELYREYGFKRLTVQYVDLRGGPGRTVPTGGAEDGEELVVESYEMQSSLAAYGIYSISRHDCGAPDTGFTYSCPGPYQIQCAADSLYVRVLNGTGSVRAQAASRALLRSRVQGTGQPRIRFPALFAAPALKASQERVLFLTGPLALQNGLPDWGDLLEGVDGFALYAAALDGEQGTIAELQLADATDAARVAERIGVDSGSVGARRMAGALKGYAVWTSPLTVRLLETTAPPSGLGDLLTALSSPEQ